MNKQLSLALCLFFILVTPVVKSQNKSKVDSLENLLKLNQINDTTKVNLLYEIAFAVHGADNDNALKYSKLSVELAGRLNYKKGIIKSLCALGMEYAETNINLAIENVTKGLRMAETIQSNSDIAFCSSLLGSLYNGSDRNKALEYHLNAIHLAEKKNDQKSLALFIYRLGVFYMKCAEYDKSITTTLKALKMAETIGDKIAQSNCLRILGMVYNFQGKYPQSLEYNLRNLSLIESSNNRLQIFLALNEIANLYQALNYYSKANFYQQRALKMAYELKNKRDILMCYNNIGVNYRQMHDPRAIEFHERTLKMAKELKETMFIISSLRGLAPLYVQQGKIDVGLEYYKKTLKLGSNKPSPSICGIYLEMGNAYILKKQYADALQCTLKAKEYANKMNSMDTNIDINKQLTEIYAATNDFSKAYYHYKRFTEIKDSVYNTKNTKRIAELEYNYKFEKEKHNIELKQQKKDTIHKAIVISLLVGILFLSLFAVYVYRSLRAKHKTNLLLTEQNNKIEKLNAEYRILNEEYQELNKQLKLSNAQINKELELNQKSLTASTLKIIQNAERDAYTIQRLLQIEKHTDGDGKRELNALVSDYKRASYNSNWEEFEILFEKVHGSFYKDINSSFPTLTSNERKLCAFLKLNMSNKDIANITFQSEEALKKARLRLRQKLQIDREINLSTYLQAV